MAPAHLSTEKDRVARREAFDNGWVTVRPIPTGGAGAKRLLTQTPDEQSHVPLGQLAISPHVPKIKADGTECKVCDGVTRNPVKLTDQVALLAGITAY
jgi:hypothetical protein